MRMMRVLPGLLMLLLLVSPAGGSESGEPEELDRLLAPIALYPDALLSTVLIAATHPLDVVKAARWSRSHPHLRGSQAVAAVEDESWDEAVKALVAFPDLLRHMSEHLDWTVQLGDAVVFHEADVMEAVQRLRSRAWHSGAFADADGLAIDHDRQQRIIVQSRYTRVVPVPVYDPRVVYGPGWYVGSPPSHWRSHRGGRSIGGVRVIVPGGFFFSYIDWEHRHITVIDARKPPVPPPAHHQRSGLRRGGHVIWRGHGAHDREAPGRHTRRYGIPPRDPPPRITLPGTSEESTPRRRSAPPRVQAPDAGRQFTTPESGRDPGASRFDRQRQWNTRRPESRSGPRHGSGRERPSDPRPSIQLPR